MPIARVNGVGIYHELAGAGEPLVLVHGSWDDHSVWASVAPSLARSHRVLSFDRRGHSHSERPATPGSVHEDAEDLAALIEELGLAPAHVVSNSLGGIVAMRLAARRPELIRTLAMHEPPAFDLLADDPDSREMVAGAHEFMDSVGGAIVAGAHEEGARLFVEGIGGPGAWDETPEPVRELMVRNAPTFLDETRDPDIVGADLNALAAFRAPTLLTSGGGSFPLFDRVVERLVATIPNAEHRVLPGAGHEPHVTQPEAYVAALKAFLPA